METFRWAYTSGRQHCDPGGVQMKRVLITIATLIGSLTWAGPASATLLTYTITPPDTPDTSLFYPSHPISFSFDTGMATGLDFRSGSGYIDVTSDDEVPFTLGNGGVLNRIYYQGYGDPLTGIVSVLNLYPRGGAGSAYMDLYDELISFRGRTPVFATGDFTISDQAGQLVALSIRSGAQGAVPEPGSWMLLILGFGMIGSSQRRRRALIRCP